MDSRLRGNNGKDAVDVIPAKAGIHTAYPNTNAGSRTEGWLREPCAWLAVSAHRIGGVNRPVRHPVHGPATEPLDETAATGTNPRVGWNSSSSEGAADHFGKWRAIARDGSRKRIALPRQWRVDRLARLDIQSLPTPSK